MAQVAPAADHDPVHQLCRLVDAETYTFLQPTIEHQQTALNAAKALIDPLARDIIDAQTLRRNENRRKRKRGSDYVEDSVLHLRQVYTNGLAVKQVWEQARRILDSALDEVERDTQHDLKPMLNGTAKINGHKSTEESEAEDEAAEDGDDTPASGSGEEDLSEDFDEDEVSEDAEDIEDDSDILASDDEESGIEPVPDETYVQDPNKLNDGFFSIDDFNKQSQFLEQMDARGDEDEPSDEDEIDWTADPLTQSFNKPKPGHEGDGQEDKEDDSDDDEEDGPTFGNANLDGLSDDEDANLDVDPDDLADAMPGLTNTNTVYYADFFEPPPKKASKSKRMRALPKTQPPKQEATSIKTEAEQSALDRDLERAMADVRRDIFDSEDDMDALDGALSDDSQHAGPKAKSKRSQNLSTHERQRQALSEEISRLEALNVSKRPWTLSGEATAQARPFNSLLEEDLDFERAGKPVPVITAEITDDIEALIKRRILAREFDEVIRRRPTSLNDAADTRRGRVEVDDTKATTGLGQIYEEDYQRNADPAAYESKLDKATKKQHDEISRLWNEVRDQLDVLGNLHFKPKRLEVEVKTVEDKPRIAMEDARPGAEGAEDMNQSMLAPQEVYAPGRDSKASKTEVLRKGGATVSREEMSREEKLRRRRREKERIKKASGQKEKDRMQVGKDGKVIKKKATKAEEQQNVLDDLQQGGVKIIGKGGALQAVEGKKGRKAKTQQDGTAVASGSSMKL